VYPRWFPSKWHRASFKSCPLKLLCIASLWAGLFFLVSERPVYSGDNPNRPKQSIPLPALLQTVEAKYARISTISAEFVQITENIALNNKKKTSSGKIFLKKPSRIRWEVLKPDVSLLVSNGKTTWYYTPPFDEGEKGQLIEKKSAQIQSKLAEALLAGSFSSHQFKQIKQTAPNIFLLTPKPSTAGTVIKATLEIDLSNHLIQKVILEHHEGNRTEITLSKISLGAPLADSLFHFTSPPNTDVIEN